VGHTFRKEHSASKQKNFVLYFLMTIVIVYIAVPTYGIIRDLGRGEAIFVLSAPVTEVDHNRFQRGILERIHQFLFPPEEVPVPVLQRIDLKGRVLYTDKTPYAHGLIMLESKPRYTRMDRGGYFLFEDVSVGLHTVRVLDDNENELVQCTIMIDRTTDVEVAEIVRLPDQTIVFRVSVDIKVLEISLHLKKDDDGVAVEIERVELGIPPDEPAEPTLPEHPVEPEPENPVKPKKPPVKPEPFDFKVLDTATSQYYGGENVANVNIFGREKRIAPGMEGTYQFTVDNRKNRYPTLYDITFTAIDTLPATHKIPLCYRLKKEGAYVAGNDTTWCTPHELYQDTVIAGESTAKYILEWYWPEGKNDNDFATFGGKPEYSYSLIIKVTAQRE
jgi:hypothetical protein